MSFLTHAAHGVTQPKYVDQYSNGGITVKHLMRYLVDTTAGPSSFSLPSGAPVGFKFILRDLAGTFETNNCTLLNSGEKIMNVVDSYVLNVNNIEREFEKIDAGSNPRWLIRKVG